MIAYDIITPKGDYSIVYISPYRVVTKLAIFQHRPNENGKIVILTDIRMVKIIRMVPIRKSFIDHYL